MIHANGGTAAGARVQTRQRKPDEPLHRQACLRQRLAPAPGSDWSQERLPPAVTRAESALLLEPSEQWVLSLLSSHFKVERGLGCRGIVVSPPRPIALRLLSPLIKLHGRLSGEEGGLVGETVFAKTADGIALCSQPSARKKTGTADRPQRCPEFL